MNAGILLNGVSCLIIFNTINEANACPQECTCKTAGKSNLTSIHLELDCKNKLMSKFPNMIKMAGNTIRKMNMRGNMFMNFTLTSETFNGLEIAELDLSDNIFADFSHDVFRTLDNLTVLILNNCSLGSDDLDFLRDLHHLSELSLRENQIGRLSDKVLSGTSIAKLDLSKNKGLVILRDDLSTISETLHTLIIDDANISLKQLDFLYQLTNLRVLSLNGVSPTNRISGGTFKNLHIVNLTKLSIVDSGIQKVYNESFDGIPNLTSLDLSYNDLSNTIFHDVKNLKHIRKLNFSYNPKIDYVPEIYNVHLEELILEGSGVSVISYNAFQNNQNSLSYLNLRSCKLPAEPYFLVEAFRSALALKKLDLSYNKITRIYNETFDDLNALEYLDISGNEIQIADTDFSGLELSLKVLYMRDMKLKTLPNKALMILEKLQVFDASFNYFSNISVNFFDGLLFDTFRLVQCNISKIDPNAFRSWHHSNLILDDNNITDMSGFKHLHHCTFKVLSLKGINLSCDCSTFTKFSYIACGQVFGHCFYGNRSVELSTYIRECRTRYAQYECPTNVHCASCKTTFTSIVLVYLLLLNKLYFCNM